MRRVRFVLLSAALAVGLLSTPAAATYPGDNGRISYGRWSEGGDSEVSLRTVRANGNDVNVLPKGAAFHQSSWSPNGRRIVYLKGANTFAANQLWVMRADGSHRERLATAANDMARPKFLPSGNKIVYSVLGDNG